MAGEIVIGATQEHGGGLRVMRFGLKIRELEQTYDAALKSKAYRSCPVGQEVGRYLRALLWEGRPKTTLDAYEQVLSRLALDHDHFESLDAFASPVGTEYIREFLERHWAHAASSTKGQRLAIVRSFFKWGVGEGRLSFNPAAAIRAPRRPDTEREAHARIVLERLIACQTSLRDQCAVLLLVRLALRKNDLRMLQIKDIDLVRDVIALRHGKGGTSTLQPFVYDDLRGALATHIAADERGPDEYLLYPRSRKLSPMDPSTLHRWFKRCLEVAELPDFPMHELRHTAADEMWRTTDNIVLAKELLRHRSVGSTERYLHPSKDDLRAGMRRVAESWKEK